MTFPAAGAACDSTGPAPCRASRAPSSAIAGVPLPRGLGDAAVAALVAFLALLPRLEGTFSPGKYLWAEDGTIFIRQAARLGFSSLFEPYAGYLHLYPRLAALLASPFGLRIQAGILFAGWCLAFFAMAHLVFRRARDCGLAPQWGALLLALIVLQPSYGEVFFNITNAQFMLAVALMLCFLPGMPAPRPTPLRLLALGVACLTGPFSLFLAAALLVRCCVERTLPADWRLFVPVAAGAVVQALCLAFSDRVGTAGIASDPLAWMHALALMLALGASTPLAVLAATLFWLLLLSLLLAPAGRFAAAVPHRRVALFCLLLAFINVLAALYSARSHPLAVVPSGGGNRYTWVPYALIFFAALAASTGHAAQRSLLATGLALLCAGAFQPVRMTDLRFASHANLANYTSVSIPLNPVWPAYPGWHIDWLAGQDRLSSLRSLRIDPDAVDVAGMTLVGEGEGLRFVASENDPAIVPRARIACGAARDIAVDIELSRAGEGWTQLFWSASGDFSEARSLRRFHPAGPVRVRHAFPNPSARPEGIVLRFDPLEGPGEGRITDFRVYCLP